MKRAHLLSLAVALAAAAACTDDEPQNAQPALSEPPAPILTAKNIPADAPSVCVATVRQRDVVLAAVGAPNGVGPSTVLSARQRSDLAALDAMVADVCH